MCLLKECARTRYSPITGGTFIQSTRSGPVVSGHFDLFVH